MDEDDDSISEINRVFNERKRANTRSVPFIQKEEYDKLASRLAVAEAAEKVWKQRYIRAENLVAQLSDKYNGEPCAEIRWQQEREDMRATIAAQARALAAGNCALASSKRRRIDTKTPAGAGG